MNAPQMPPIPPNISAIESPIPKPEFGAFPFLAVAVAVEEAILDARDN